MPANPRNGWGEIAERLVPHLRKPDEVEPDVVIGSLRRPEAELNDIGRALGLVPSSLEPYSKFSSPRPPLKQPPYTFRSDLDARHFVNFERDYGKIAKTTTQVYPHDTRIEFESRAKFCGPGAVLLRLESSLFDGLPRHPVLASMIYSEATWRDNSLQIATHATNAYEFTTNAPTLRDAAWRLIHDRCADAAPSHKGRTAVRLLEVGGHDALLDGNVRRSVEALRTRRSRNLLRELRKRRSEGQTDNDLVDLALQWGGMQQRHFCSVEQLRSADVSDGARSVELLCQQGWAERGLSIACDRCSIRSFVAMDQTRPQGLCPACQAPQPYEVDGDGASALQYRLHALIDFAADQGVLPHVMAIAALHKRNERTFLIPGADVAFAAMPPREVDLFGIHDNTVVAGEAKTSPSGFQDSDLKADIELTSALGADTHLMVAIGEIAEPVIEQAKQLTQAVNLGLILIEGENITYVSGDD